MTKKRGQGRIETILNIFKWENQPVKGQTYISFNTVEKLLPWLVFWMKGIFEWGWYGDCNENGLQ